jgi:anaerobic magnesium-protoporphyrin IX monomethyl ester cyclase
LKVLLIDPKVYGDLPGAMAPNLGLAYLVSVLSENGVDVEVLDMRLGYSVHDCLLKIHSFKPDLIGFTVYSIRFESTQRLVNLVKENANCPLVIGGPHVSACRSEVLKNMKADFAVKGEGEYTLLELCTFLESGNKEFQVINGLIWRNRNTIIENVDRPHINGLDALPFPAFEKFELQKYTFFKEKRMPIITSRGCPYRCNFCSVKLSMGQNFRPRSPENIILELEFWYSKGWRQFDFQDDCFSFNLNRAKKICDLILEKKLAIKWFLGNGIRVDRVDYELLNKMKKSRCVYVQYGVESGSNAVLKAIGKGITIEQALKVIELTQKVGISQSVNFMIGHKSESFEDATQTLNFARYISSKGVLVNVYNIVPYPGTELYQYVKECGSFLLPKEVYLNSVTYGVAKPVFETTEFKGVDRERVMKAGLSISRKSWLQGKFGHAVGSLLWVLTGFGSVNKMFSKLALGTRFGRRLYNFIKRN